MVENEKMEEPANEENKLEIEGDGQNFYSKNENQF